MNPSITATGDLSSGSPKMYITRKLATILVASSTSSVKVTPSLLSINDGAKILSMKIYALDERTLTVNVPNTTILTVNTGSTTAPFGGFIKTVAAPLSRFPMIKVNIPDQLAAPLNSDSTEELLTVSNSGATPKFRVVYTAKYLA